MRRWFPVLFAACLAALAPSARAAVQFQGLSYTPQGACVADVDGDGRLSLHNIGSSGQDGVSIWSPRSNGMRVALDGQCSSLDVGSSVSLECTFSLNGLPPGQPVLRVASSTFSVSSSSQCTAACDFGQLSSSSSMELVLYRGGERVYSVTVPRSSHLQVALDATGQCPNPALSLYTERAPSSSMMCSRFSFSSSVHVSSAEGLFPDEDCDGFVFRCPKDEDCDGVSSFLRVVAPPTSSFSSLTCSSGACRALDHWVHTTGQATLDVADVGSTRRVRVSNIGSSGQDGVEVLSSRRAPIQPMGGGFVLHGEDCDDGDAVSMRFSPPGLVFDPSSDAGSSSVLTVVGNAFSSSGASLGSASASLTLTVVGSNFFAIPSHTGGGMDQEWVSVFSHGVEVARALLAPGAHVQVDAPPGGPLGMAINEKGLPGEKGTKSTTKKMLAGGGVDLASTDRISSSSSTRGSLVLLPRVLHVSFAHDRVFVWGGVSATGDELVCWAASSSGADDGLFEVTQCREFVRCASSSSSLSSMELLDVVSSGGDAVTPVVGSSSVSSASTCTSIPFVFSRTDETPARAFSVTFHLSSELASCGASVVEGDYLSRVAGTQLFVTDNGGGSYTVDCGIMGTVCGATGDGTLFSLQLGAAAGVVSGVGQVVVDDVVVRDCSNQPVPASPGATGFVPIQLSAPPALSSFSATQVLSGNPAGSSTTGVQLSWTPPPATSSVEVWRKGFGNYPLYDNAPNAGAVPSPPATPAAASSSGWSLVQCACSSGACGASSCTTPTGMLDQPPARDFLYYVAFVRDAYGNPSAVSSMSSGTLDYHLGDVSTGTVAGQGDDQVDIADVTLLGAHYGTVLPPGSPFSYLDVGPTTDFSTHARPTTDGRVNFEDFMMFAINYGAVSAPEGYARPAAAAANALRLDVPPVPGVGGTFVAALQADGAGDAQAISARLAFDAAVVEPVGVEPGALLDQQGRPGAVLSSDPGDVDVALLGAGPGLAGSGELARVTFRVKAAGDPRLGIASVRARDGGNQEVAVAGVSGGPVAARTGLSLASTNPFRDQLALQLSLPASGPASVAVFDVAGRRVRTLVSGAQAAGTRTVTWDGRDDAGLRLAPGAYVIRLHAGALAESREVRLVR